MKEIKNSLYNIEEDDYLPTSIDSEVFISEIPFSLLKETITSQFRNPTETKTDYVTIFIDNFNYSMEECDEDDREELLDIYDDFVRFMKGLFMEYFNIGIVDIDHESKNYTDEAILMVYRFFVLNIKKNFNSLIQNYIQKYEKEICSMFTKKKDITSLSFKNQITDPNDVIIVSNVNTIIMNILQSDMDVDEFLSLIKNSIESRWLSSAYDNFKVTGNFVDKYKEVLTDEIISTIETSIRRKILKKYNN